MSDEDHRRVIYSAFATFAAHTSVLPLERRLYFYELLALDLTVAIRTVWSDEHLPDAEKVEVMKWMNEAIHHVLERIPSHRNQSYVASEDDLAHMLQNYAALSPHVHWLIAQAVWGALRGLDYSPNNT
jgi:hypothetical protein